MASGAFIAATLTRKGNDPGGWPTSEFSGVRNSAATAVCTELTSGSGADMVVDENYPTITLLKAKDSNGNPINYVVSGGADKAMFTITAPVVGATLDCATVKFIEYNIIITRDAPLEAETRAIVLPDSQPNPGDYELPQDSDKNNVYQFQITATYADGQHYTRDFSVQVSNVNEAPTITSAAAVSFNEDSSAAVLDIASQDPDAGTVEGNGLTYSITGGADARLLSVEPASGILKFRAPPDYDAPTDTNRDNVYEAQVTVTDSGGLSNSKLFQITVVNNPADDGALLNVKTLLQGAYDSNSGLMSGDLNALGLLPPKQPYTAAPFNYSGTETLSSLVQEATGNSAIVDWVLVDLRTSPTSIAATRALMLRRDGRWWMPRPARPTCTSPM
ncbi:MAG: cadherin repeat domain-containing protein [Candidatus Thiothrix singaporensis]|uniref:Cadherin repeat domain-containing protein n=1 Tax=Candidatus Thiothrix singaporensis TaxID=2799669 RepID=A0A7L6APW0_9GAMM|nr:MAG: cadherin repeat domain-containing protein [Candidatus Thiothrix singaporensis]